MCVLWFGARQVIQGKLTAGQLSAFVVYAVFVSANVGALAGVFSSLIRVRTHYLPLFHKISFEISSRAGGESNSPATGAFVSPSRMYLIQITSMTWLESLRNLVGAVLSYNWKFIMCSHILLSFYVLTTLHEDVHVGLSAVPRINIFLIRSTCCNAFSLAGGWCQ